MRGVGGADAQLVLEANQLEARGVARDDEGLDGCAACGLVHGGPDDHVGAALTGGDEDLLAVQDVLVAVQLRGRGDGRGVGAELRLGDGHGGPDLAEALELLVGGDGGDGCVAQALVRDGQGEADVAPAGLHDVQGGGHVATVLHAGVLLLVPAAAGSAGHGHATISGTLDEGCHGVELDRALVLLEVVLAGDGAENLCGRLVCLVGARLQTLGKFQIKHDLFPLLSGLCCA